jgi:crotonobetainyl-CoA:carnitine CoA-transferase CaiB-like acyl-CoA transferase
MQDSTDAAQPLPLARISVLDLTLARAGPTCVRHLADWGANVVRIEPPSTGGEDIGGSRDGPDFQNLHRNKRAIRLDLKAPEGHAVFMRLAAHADVIVENMRAAVKHRLRIAYEDVRAHHPRIVYCSISGFGQDGPYAERPGVDQIAQGLGGLMSITGLPGQGPVRVGIPVADLTAGNLLAFGIMLALFEREATGVGRWVQTSLLEAQVFMLDFQAARWLMEGEVAGQAGNDHPTAIPTGVFPASDGLINLAASSGRQWERFCDAVGHPEWQARPEWRTQIGRSADRVALNAAIAEVTRTRPAAEWIDMLTGAGIPCGSINRIDEVFADPQVQYLGIARPVAHPRLGAQHVVASPLNVSGVPKDIRAAAPDIAADTAAVLGEAGYSAAEIAALRARGVI